VGAAAAGETAAAAATAAAVAGVAPGAPAVTAAATAATAAGEPPQGSTWGPAVWPGRHCESRQTMPFTARNEGSEYVG